MDRVKASGLDFPESSRLKKHLSAATDWINKANSALAGSIQLRDLDKLLTEADKLAVDPGPKLDELKAKMDKALVWLEKVRKAVPRQRATRRNAPDVEAEKVSSSFHFYQSIRICLRLQLVNRLVGMRGDSRGCCAITYLALV